MRIFLHWWSDVNLKTRLMAAITLSVSILMSSLTFWVLTIIQGDSKLTDERFCKDLSLLFASNIINLVDQGNQKELASFIEKTYLNTSSIRYIFLFNTDGSLLLSLPFYNSKIQSIFQLHYNFFQLQTQDFLFNTPIIEPSKIFNDNITNIIVPLVKEGKNLGTLALGINPNPMISSASKLTRDLSITIFVSIWLMVIIGATFNTLTITEPIKELLYGVKRIASGNFKQRIDLPFGGELGDLIISFNEMAERLESYDKKNIECLIAEQAKLETIVSIIADGAILIDTELRLLFVNEIAMNILSLPRTDIVGTSIINYLPTHFCEALLPALNNLIVKTCLDEKNCKMEELYIDLNYNSPKRFRILLTAVLDRHIKTFASIAITIQDITKEFLLNEAKNQFVSNVSHELRTPLCNIGSFLETLSDYHESLTQEQRRKFLTIAHMETKRLTRLVNDVLDLSRLESEYHYKLVTIDLFDLISTSIDSYQLRVSDNEVSIVLEFPKETLYVSAHASSILQVFANLLSNALKFSHLKGTIVVRVFLVPVRNKKAAKLNQQIVRIEIIDNGIGIDLVDQKSVFDRFVRIENEIHTLEGTGLGLSIVKNIIEKHNTDIHIYSELGVGTSLWFDLKQASV